MQAYRTLTSRWTPFAVRWALPTAIDYYGVLRPHMITSGAAAPSFFRRRIMQVLLFRWYVSPWT